MLPTGEVNVADGLRRGRGETGHARAGHALVNGEPVGSGRMDHTVPFGFSGYSGLDVGRDNGLVVDRSYADKAPFAFTGTVKKVVFDVAPHLDDRTNTPSTRTPHQADTVRGVNARPP